MSLPVQPIQRFLGESWFAKHWLAASVDGAPVQVWELVADDSSEMVGIVKSLERWRAILHPALTPILGTDGTGAYVVADDRGPNLVATAQFVRRRLGIEPTPFVIAQTIELAAALVLAAEHLGTHDGSVLHGSLVSSALYAAETPDPAWPVRIRLVPPVAIPRRGSSYRGLERSGVHLCHWTAMTAAGRMCISSRSASTWRWSVTILSHKTIRRSCTEPSTYGIPEIRRLRRPHSGRELRRLSTRCWHERSASDPRIGIRT